MAIRTNKGEVIHNGEVLMIKEQYYTDGMLEETAVFWDKEKHCVDARVVGYYGNDGRNLVGEYAEVDRNEETILDILRTLKQSATKAYAEDMTKEKERICSGRTAEVVKGRKVKKGTVLNIFWVGEKETYYSKTHAWMNEKELIAGGYDEEGNKVFVKAEYLKNLTPVESYNSKERDKYIKAYIKEHARKLGIFWKNGRYC